MKRHTGVYIFTIEYWHVFIHHQKMAELKLEKECALYPLLWIKFQLPTFTVFHYHLDNSYSFLFSFLHVILYQCALLHTHTHTHTIILYMYMHGRLGLTYEGQHTTSFWDSAHWKSLFSRNAIMTLDLIKRESACCWWESEWYALSNFKKTGARGVDQL